MLEAHNLPLYTPCIHTSAMSPLKLDTRALTTMEDDWIFLRGSAEDGVMHLALQEGNIIVEKRVIFCNFRYQSLQNSYQQRTLLPIC